MWYVLSRDHINSCLADLVLSELGHIGMPAAFDVMVTHVTLNEASNCGLCSSCS